MKFNNRENEKITLANGRVLWNSRSVALVAVILVVLDDGQGYVLMNKRGPSCPDEVGKWVMPCGYLDWDESCVDGCIREVYEETGLDVGILSERSVFNSFEDEQPFYVSSKPKNDNKQNVSHYYGLAADAHELPELTSEHCAPGEVEELAWVKLQDLDNLEVGFSHLAIIERFVDVLDDKV